MIGKLSSLSRPHSQQGFMLLEALIAVLIFSVGILSLVGLQSTATRYSTDAKFRSTASYLANQRIAEIWVADHSKITASPYVETNTALAALPSGKRTVTVIGDVAAGYVVTVTIAWQMPGDSTAHQLVAVTEIHDKCDTAACAV
jgi:type IV pilus assembly protein PilV